MRIEGYIWILTVEQILLRGLDLAGSGNRHTISPVNLRLQDLGILLDLAEAILERIISRTVVCRDGIEVQLRSSQQSVNSISQKDADLDAGGDDGGDHTLPGLTRVPVGSSCHRGR